nr:hypothetical protein [Mucilaginibacter sp. L294]
MQENYQSGRWTDTLALSIEMTRRFELHFDKVRVLSDYHSFKFFYTVWKGGKTYVNVAQLVDLPNVPIEKRIAFIDNEIEIINQALLTV